METGQNYDFLSSDLVISSFILYRCDRDYTGTGVTKVGGVLICIIKKYSSNCLSIPSINSNFEQLFVHVQLSSKELLTANVYFAPKSCNDSYISLFSLLNLVKSYYSDSDVNISGDFNLPNLNWVFNKQNAYNNRHVYSQAVTVLDEFAYLNCRQFNERYNPLGLIFSNITKAIVNSGPDKAILALAAILYHPVLSIYLAHD